MSTFPQRLLAARVAKRITQEELAAMTGINCTQISHYERGARKPRMSNLAKLADALGNTTDYLMGR